MMKPFIIRDSCLQKDSWTHGDYVQYVAFVDDDTAVVCRRSMAPTIFGALGLAMLAALFLIVFNADYTRIDWWGVFFVAVIGFALIGPAVVEWITPWKWMVQTQREMKRLPDGSFRRDYLDE